MRLFIGAEIIAAVLATRTGNPCPSACWTWNAANGACDINLGAEACFTLTCEHDRMKLQFTSDLYAVSDTSPSTVFGDSNAPTFDATGTGEWEMDCPLGECGMAVASEVIDTVSNLVFSFSVGKTMNKISLSGNDVYIDPVSSVMKYKCAYPATFDITSDEFEIKGATASGETQQSGDLTTGFALSVYTDEAQTTPADATNVFVGYPVYADMTWSVTSAQTVVNFYLNDCDLIDGADEIEMIKDNCYSASLGAKQLQATKMVADSSKFTFIAFTVGEGGRLQMTSTLRCTVKLCIMTDAACGNQLTSQDADCDGVAETAYQYKANSFGT